MKSVSLLVLLIVITMAYLYQQLGLSLWGVSHAEAPETYAKDLRSRQELLDERERALSKRETELRERETILKSQVARYEAAIQDSMVQLDSLKSAQMEGLKQIYEKMEPKKAARILDEMEISMAHRILSSIREDRAADIMSRMRSERARLVSERQLKLSSNVKKVNEGSEEERKGGDK